MGDAGHYLNESCPSDEARHVSILGACQDGASNWAAWKAGSSFTVTPYQEGSTAANGKVGYDGTWAIQSLSGFYGGAVRHASAKGATATFSFTSVGQVAWVAPKGANRGYAYVYLDGTKVATVNLHTSSAQYHKIVYAKAWSTSGTHTLKVYVSGTKPAASTGARGDIDALLMLR